MDFNQIRYFLALAETLNFTRAAERCDVSQPALTQSIRRLESELGGSLIRREGVASSLTPLGLALQGQFKQLDLTRQLVETTAASVTSGAQATIKIGVMCTIGHPQLMPVLRDFVERNPAVSLVFHDVVPESITDLLVTGAIDCAFCSSPKREANRVRYQTLFTESMVLACAQEHRFAGVASVTLEEIAQERYVDRLHCEFRGRFFDYLHERELPPEIVASSHREDWVQGLLAQNIGVSVLPEYTLLASGVVVRLIAAQLSRQVEFALLNNASPNPALGALLKAIQSHWCT